MSSLFARLVVVWRQPHENWVLASSGLGPHSATYPHPRSVLGCHRLESGWWGFGAGPGFVDCPSNIPSPLFLCEKGSEVNRGQTLVRAEWPRALVFQTSICLLNPPQLPSSPFMGSLLGYHLIKNTHFPTNQSREWGLAWPPSLCDGACAP